MPLWVWAGLVGAGLLLGAGILFVFHLRRRKTPLGEPRDVVAAIKLYLRNRRLDASDVSWSALSEDGMVGLAEIRDGRVGLVLAGFRQPKVSVLKGGDVRSASVSKDGFSLTIDLGGWIGRPVTLVVDDPSKAIYARQLVDRLTP